MYRTVVAADCLSMNVVSSCGRRCVTWMVGLQARLTADSGFRAERGASLVEYALLVGLLALVCFGAVTIFGNDTSQIYSDVGNSIN